MQFTKKTGLRVRVMDRASRGTKWNSARMSDEFFAIWKRVSEATNWQRNMNL
jgi:hypothetical protein